MVSRLEPAGWVISFKGGKGIGSSSELIKLSRAAFINAFAESAGRLTTERVSPAKQPVSSMGTLVAFPSSWLSFMLPSSCQAQRPFYFLTQNLVSVFRLTFSSVCVLLCCKTITISTVGSWAKSSLTHPLSIEELFKMREHTSGLPFCWYFCICLEGICVNVTLDELLSCAPSSS